MIFCVFLDPESIRHAAAQGELGADHLIGVLRALLENCLLAETTDWQVGAELKEAVKAIEDPNLRKRAVSVLESFAKRNRFAAFLEPTAEEPDAPPAAVALANRDHPSLDVIVTETADPPSDGVEVTSINRFNSSDFAAQRSRDSRGRSLQTGSLDATAFFETFFSKLLLLGLPKWEVCDYALGGSGFGPNYFHNLKWWIEFLAQSPEEIEFIIHTKGRLAVRIQSRLDELCDDTCVRARVREHVSLPHERYLITSAFTFNIGRGIDLIDFQTGKNRDINISHSPLLGSMFG